MVGKATALFHKYYRGFRFDKERFSQKFGIPVKELDRVYDEVLKIGGHGLAREVIYRLLLRKAGRI